MSDDLTKAARIAYQYVMAARQNDRVAFQPGVGLWAQSEMTLDENVVPQEILNADQSISSAETILALGGSDEREDFVKFLVKDVERWRDSLKHDLINLADFFAASAMDGMPTVDKTEKAALLKHTPKLAELVS